MFGVVGASGAHRGHDERTTGWLLNGTSQITDYKFQVFVHISIEANTSIKRDQYRFFNVKDGKDVTNKVDIV